MNARGRSAVAIVALRAIALAASWLLPLTAAGQAGAAAQVAATADDYDRLVAEAVAEFNTGAWLEARALFEQAHALRPNARTLRGLGLTSFELRRYVDAVGELQAALADARQPLEPRQRTEVEQVLARAHRYVGTVKVELEPSDAQLLLGGVPTASRELLLAVGDYPLLAKAKGYSDAVVELHVEGGKARALRLALVPLGERGRAEVAGARGDGESGDSGTWQRVLGWTGIGTAAVGVTLGVVFQLKRSDQLGQRDAICPSGRDCMSDDQRKIDALTGDARTSTAISLTSFIGGALFAAGGVALLLTAPSGAESESPEVALLPALGPGSAGMVLRARGLE